MPLPVYVINLDQDVDRLASMERRLGALKLPFRRFVAYRGRNIPERWRQKFGLSQQVASTSILTDGEVGCYVSHLGVLEEFLTTDAAMALVLEDDVEFHSCFLEMLDNLKALPKKWDIVRLSNIPTRTVWISEGELANGMEVMNYYKIPEESGAYIISRSGARKILDNDKIRTVPYDNSIGDGAYIYNLITYGIYPAPIRKAKSVVSSIEVVDDSHSDSTRKSSDYRTTLMKLITRPSISRDARNYFRKILFRIRSLSLEGWLCCQWRKRRNRILRNKGKTVPSRDLRLERQSMRIGTLRKRVRQWRRKVRKDLLLRGTGEQVFSRIYRRNPWGSRESKSGWGSELSYTVNLRRELPELIRDYGVIRLLDAPCGDFNWMQHVVPDLDIEYIGGDIVKALVRRNQRKFGAPGTVFRHMDITSDPLPAADLMMVRDCLFHLSYDDIYRFLENFCRSDIGLLLTTTRPPADGANSDIRTGDFRHIHIFPPTPLRRIDDYVPPHPPREMCLFAKEQVAAARDAMQHNLGP